MNTGTTWQTITRSSGDTEAVAAQLAPHLRGGETIELKSDLGGGKTTFVRGLVGALGSSDHVASPTFMISKEYQTPQFRVVHFDFYRLRTAAGITEALQEAALDDGTVCIVEWGDIVEDVLPADRIIVHFDRMADDEDGRRITIQAPHKYLPQEPKK